MPDSVRPHRQPTRLPRPWDSPGKNTGVGCYFLLQCMKVKSESEVTQSCPTLSDLMDCSPPGSSDHGIFQARVLEWVPLPSPTEVTEQRLNQIKVCFLFFNFLAALHGMWDLSSPTRDGTCTLCSGSTESQPLDLQGSPSLIVFWREDA